MRLDGLRLQGRHAAPAACGRLAPLPALWSVSVVNCLLIARSDGLGLPLDEAASSRSRYSLLTLIAPLVVNCLLTEQVHPRRRHQLQRHPEREPEIALHLLSILGGRGERRYADCH